jgi:hypothetical protein
MIRTVAGKVFLIIAGTIAAALACSPVLQPAMLAKTWPVENYLLLFQPGSDNQQNSGMSALLKGAQAKWFDKTNVRLVELPKKGERPSLSLVSPRGRLLDNLEGAVTDGTLESLFTSPVRKKIMEAYSDKALLVLVHWKAEKKALDDKNSGVIKEVVKKISVMQDQNIRVVESDLNDKREEFLRKCLNLQTKESTPAATLLLWNGRPATTFYNELDEGALLAFIQDTYQQASASVMPWQYQENILIFQPGK